MEIVLPYPRAFSSLSLLRDENRRSCPSRRGWKIELLIMSEERARHDEVRRGLIRLQNRLPRLFEAGTKDQDEKHPLNEAHRSDDRARTFPGFLSPTGLCRDRGEATSNLKAGLTGEERCRLKWGGTPFSTPVRRVTRHGRRDGNSGDFLRRGSYAACWERVSAPPLPPLKSSRAARGSRGAFEQDSWLWVAERSAGRCGRICLGLLSPTLLKEPSHLWFVRAILLYR